MRSINAQISGSLLLPERIKLSTSPFIPIVPKLNITPFSAKMIGRGIEVTRDKKCSVEAKEIKNA